MLFSMQLAKSLHVIGLAMLFGGLLGSFLIAYKFKGDTKFDPITRIMSHVLAGIGLVLVIASGVWYSSLINWVVFKDAGFMHAKMLFVLLIFVFLFIEIRAQGIMRRAIQADQDTQNLESLKDKLIKRRIVSGALSIICFLFIVVLIEFRFF